MSGGNNTSFQTFLVYNMRPTSIGTGSSFKKLGGGNNVVQSIWNKTPIKQIMCDDQVQVLFVHVQNAIEFFQYEFDEERKAVNLVHIKRIQESQGLTCFTLDECKRNLRLLICTKKKLTILHYTEHDCISIGIDSEELILPEAVNDTTCIAFYDKSLIVGFKKEYSMIDMGTSTSDSFSKVPMKILELGNDSKGDNKPLCAAMGDESLLRTDTICVFVNLVSKSNTERRGMPSPRPPITFSSAPQQLAFSFPYIVGILDQGKKIEIYSIYDARLVRTLFIHTNNSVISTSSESSSESNQLNNLTNWKLLQGSVGLGVFAVCDGFIPSTVNTNSSSSIGFKKDNKKEKIQTVILLAPTSYEKQISSLFEMGHCAEAFELFERMLEFKREKGAHIDPFIEKRWRQKLLQEAAFASLFHLDIEKAFRYFREHEQALDERIGYDIRELLVLFPDFRSLFVLNDNFKPSISQTFKQLRFGEKNAKNLYQYFVEIISKRKDLPISNGEVEREAEGLIFKAKKFLKPVLEYRRKKVLTIETEKKEDVLLSEVSYLSISSKCSLDNVLFKIYLESGDLPRLNKMLQEPLVKIHTHIGKEQRDVHVALLCYCSLDICSSSLRNEVEILSPEAQDYYQAQLYITSMNYTYEHLSKSLALLKNISLNSDKSELGDTALEETLSILTNMFEKPLLDEGEKGQMKKDLFWINLEWCLLLDHLKSIPVLNKNVIYLGVDAILKYIRQHLDEETQNEVIQLFLEYIIHEYNSAENEVSKKVKLDISNQYYTLLALKYIDVITSYELRNDTETILDLRTKFMMHIQACAENITLETVQSRLQGTSLYQEMILIYSLAKQHEKALRILLFELSSTEGAENYCKEQQLRYEQELYRSMMQRYEEGVLTPVEATIEMYDRNYTKVTLHNELFLILLKLCFQDSAVPKSSKQRSNLCDFGVYVLNKYAKNIDPIAAIKLLPNQLSTKKILPFLTATMRQTSTNVRTASLMKNMSKIDYAQTQSQLVVYQNRKKVVSRKSKCSFCNKFIGEDACVVVYPDMSNIFHYSCYNRDLHFDRISKRNYLRTPLWLEPVNNNGESSKK